MADSISSLPDADLIAVATQVQNVISANPGDYPGVTPAMLSDLKTFNNTFDADLTAQIALLAASRAGTQKKDGSRVPDEDELRSIRNIAKANGASPAAMAALGIPVGSSKAPASATVPALSVDTSERLRHKLDWRDKNTLDNKKKPRGAMGAEIWVKIDGTPPGSEKDCVFLTLDAFTPYTAHFDAEDANKTAHYMIRWRMRDGSTGAWGETVSATITG